jgi:hypothetical protein
MHRISDFASFILDEVPYGVVDPAQLRQGVVEYDGRGPAPDNLPVGEKKLSWCFNKRLYPIAKAVRIRYTYRATTPEYPGGKDLLASLFIGYQETQLNAPKNDPPSRGDVARATQRFDSIDGFILDGFPDGRPERNNPAAGPAAAGPAAAAAVATALDAAAQAAAARAAAAGAAAQARTAAQEAAALDAAAKIAAAQAAAQAPAPQFLPVRAFSDCQAADLEYDGLAQDRGLAPAKGVGNQFLTESLDAIARDPTKYEQLLHWHFGGRSHSVTKAIRLPYRPSPRNPVLVLSLFIGFQGPPTVR